MLPIFEVEGISKRFFFKKDSAYLEAIREISFLVKQNEFFSIIGPSGCGKTTLLYMLAGFFRPDTGTVRHCGKSVDGPGPERTVIFQEYGLFPWMTVQQNIEFGLRAKNLDRKECAKEARRLIELVHLKGFNNKYPHQLSGGMKQRVGIARGLAIRPRVILMDEPFASLDSLTREIMQEEVLQVWERQKSTAVLITHNIEEAVFLSDRVMIMTARPGSVKEIINIDLPRPRLKEIKSGPEFLKIKNHISLLVREEALKGIAEIDGRLTNARGEIIFEGETQKRRTSDAQDTS